MTVSVTVITVMMMIIPMMTMTASSVLNHIHFFTGNHKDALVRIVAILNGETTCMASILRALPCLWL